jgi:hypothetical protein
MPNPYWDWDWVIGVFLADWDWDWGLGFEGWVIGLVIGYFFKLKVVRLELFLNNG